MPDEPSVSPTLNAARATISDDQRTQLLQIVRDNADTNIGNVAAARAAGIQGTRGQISAMIDHEDGLKEEIAEARGWNVVKAKQALYEIATDPDHPAWQRANALFLKAFGGPEFRDDLRRLEHTGKDGGPIALLAGRYDLEQLTVEELEGLRALLEKARPELEAGGSVDGG